MRYKGADEFCRQTHSIRVHLTICGEASTSRETPQGSSEAEEVTRRFQEVPRGDEQGNEHFRTLATSQKSPGHAINSP